MLLEQRLLAKIALPAGPDGCMEWQGAKNGEGYGRIEHHGRKLYAHRAAYEYWNRPIPIGLEIDHLCRNRACCRPDHMEAVSHRENVRRGQAGVPQTQRTHCPAGHEYSDRATYRYPDGRRKCRICAAIQSSRRWRASRERT